MYLSFSGKGGVGKTTWARSFLDYHRANDLPLAAYDADMAVKQLVSYYGQRDAAGKLLPDQDPLVGVDYFDLKNKKEATYLLNLVADKKIGDADILIDLPGGSLTNLAELLGNAAELMTAIKDYGIQPVIIVVVTTVWGSLITIDQALASFGPEAKFVFVRNQAAVDDEDTDWLLYNEPYARRNVPVSFKETCEARGLVVDLPKLQTGTYSILDAEHLAYNKALEMELPPYYNLQLKRFISGCNAIHAKVVAL